jgi:membrane-associated phospholipid phosphatase
MNQFRWSVDPFRIAASTGGVALMLTLLISWQGTPIGGDLRIIREVQQADPLRGNEGWVNALGTFQLQLFIVLAAVAAATFGPVLRFPCGAAVERTRAIWVLVTAIGLRFLAFPLKEATQAERPLSSLGVHVSRDFAGYGFPSGHVYSDVLIFGAIALVAPALFGRAAGSAIRVVCVAIILMAGPARMVVGAHWPSDVAGGYLWGISALCLCIALASRLAHSKVTSRMAPAR